LRAITDGIAGRLTTVSDDILLRLREVCLVTEAPDRFSVPAYVGYRGWLGVHLDRNLDWDDVAGIVEDAYRLVAPRKLVAELDATADDA
jgi:hypothetical protein